MNRNLLALATAAAATAMLSACVVVPELAPYDYGPSPVYGRVVAPPPAAVVVVPPPRRYGWYGWYGRRW